MDWILSSFWNQNDDKAITVDTQQPETTRSQQRDEEEGLEGPPCDEQDETKEHLHDSQSQPTNCENEADKDGRSMESSSSSLRGSDVTRTDTQHQGEDKYNDSEQTLSLLDPPLSCTENFREAILRFLDHRFFQVLGVVVLVLIILDGALFFFLLMGWHTICDTPSRTDCEPRNAVYNISIQLLNILFTYMSLESMPWRCTHFLHVTGWSCPPRNNDIGYNLFGLPSQEIWYHIPRWRRIGICTFLLLNCITQFANQSTRIIFYSFEGSDSFPGNIWTNVFFGSSMLCALIGAVWMIYEDHLLHQQQPKKFAPNVFMMVKDFVRLRHQQVCCCCCCRLETETMHDELSLQDRANEETDHGLRPHTMIMVEPPDHVSTKHHEQLLKVERTNARFWAL